MWWRRLSDDWFMVLNLDRGSGSYKFRDNPLITSLHNYLNLHLFFSSQIICLIFFKYFKLTVYLLIKEGNFKKYDFTHALIAQF